jgi:RNA polymerase sigma-70 factor (ECF subfamily)
VARALAGSEDAFTEIVRRYERPVFSLVVRMVKDPAVAEELAQEAFLKAFRSLGTYEPERKLSSWLFKIAHNTTIDFLRRKRPETVPLEAQADDERGLGERLPDISTPSPQVEAESSELGRALAAAVRRLRPEYREVILLRFQEGLAYQEIGEVMGLPLGTVKTYIYRARKELAGLLGELGWEQVSGGG